MTNQTFNVPSIHCGHCVMTIQRELRDVAGIQFTAGDITKKTITVQVTDDNALARLKETMQEIGYPVVN